MKSELIDTITKSVKAFKTIPHDEWSRRSDPSKWSKKEILGHITDSALTNLRRFVMTQYKEKEKIIYHQDEWVQLQDYQSAEIGEMIDLWKLLNLQIARVVSRIPKDKLKNLCDTGKNDTAYHTLGFLVEDYLVHLKHHLAQILSD